MTNFRCGIAIIFGGELDEKEKSELTEFFSGDKDVIEYSFDTADITMTNKETGEEERIYPTVALITLSGMFDILFRLRFEGFAGGKLAPSPENEHIFFYTV